ncbi:MAG: hypothetical protein JWL76_1361 [Thermoleophilia bacterium]|nr:hypothetical protein [Thermoleophilia bacterium]
MPRSLRPAAFFAALTMLVVPASAISANDQAERGGDARAAHGAASANR